MMRPLFLSLFLCLLLLTGPGTSFGTSQVAAQNGPAGEIIQLVNQLRAGHGLPSFQLNSALVTAAQGHANWMAANVAYTHSGAGGSNPQSRASAAGYDGFVVENIVGGTGLTTRQGVIWWENSAVHFNTMISTRHVEVGAGYATGSQQNFYVLVVGRPSAGASEPPPGASEPETGAIRVTPIQLSPPRADGSIVHEIKDGQALWSIAAYYEVDLNYLFLINNMRPGDFLQPGDEVLVQLGEGQSPPPTPPPPRTHTVQVGQTAWSIAATYQISLADLFLYNNLHENSILQPGDEVTVRLAEGELPPPTPTPPASHIVQSGDTALAIAARYSLTLDELLAFNGLTADVLLQVGDELVIRQLPTPTPTTTNTPPPTEPAAIESEPQPVAATTLPATSAATATTAPELPSEPAALVVSEDAGRRGGGTGFGSTAVGIGLLVGAAIALRFIRQRDEVF